MSSPVKRSSELYLAAIAALDVEHAPKYRRRALNEGGPLVTWCNLYASDACHALGVVLPYILANAQVGWLSSFAARDDGWESCDEARAGDSAQLGFPTVACWRNPDPESHGHIAMVVPALGPGLHIAQAGLANFSSGPLAHGFGPLHPLFFTHP